MSRGTSTEITMERIQHLNVPGAFLLRGFLNEQECKELIQESEKRGYRLAQLNDGKGKSVMRSRVRNSKRAMWDVEESRVRALWERLKPFMPSSTEVQGKSFSPTGLNPRFRLLKYDVGEYFAKHHDAGHNGSLMTLIVYLSEGFRGGETNFYRGSRLVESVRPRQGTALLFFHDCHPLSPLHEGAPVAKSSTVPKYALRTDVYFER